MSLYPITLDQVASIQHDVTINQLANSLAKGTLFGIKTRQTVGLRLTLYGGTFPTSAGPVRLADASINVTASTTNYIYADTSGVVSKVTVAPTGWPGPMDTGYMALYQLTVGADAITSGTCYVVGPASPGVAGTIGPTGPAGSALWFQRKRYTEAVGASSTNFDSAGFTVTSTLGVGPSARSLGSTFLAESVPYVAFGGTGAGSSGQLYSQAYCSLGNASGRGGFDITFRWCFESSFSSANARCFIGLYDVAAGVFGNVEPDTILNTIGVGAKAGDANLSVIHNDGSGTATMATLGASYPARATANLYELRLVSVANSGTVDYTLTDKVAGNSTTGTVSSDLPANTKFLGWYMWINTGSAATTTTIGFMQVVSLERY